MLQQSAEVIEEHSLVSMAAKLRTTLTTEPLPKPEDHVGPVETDMFVLQLTRAERDRILCAIEQACEDKRKVVAVGESIRNLAGFREAWQEYAAWQGDDA